jgi:hypothetical protein
LVHLLLARILDRVGVIEVAQELVELLFPLVALILGGGLGSRANVGVRGLPCLAAGFGVVAAPVALSNASGITPNLTILIPRRPALADGQTLLFA